jgi:hypothetical protein
MRDRAVTIADIGRCQPLPHSPHPRDNQLLPNGLRIDDIGEHGSGAILATHNPNIDTELNKYNIDHIILDAGHGHSAGTAVPFQIALVQSAKSRPTKLGRPPNV